MIHWYFLVPAVVFGMVLGLLEAKRIIKRVAKEQGIDV